jgi:S-disulfanyl-L-cysteine oxidoreductase SoxD
MTASQQTTCAGVLIASLALGIGTATPSLAAQGAGKSTMDGVYTEAQSTRGTAAATASCSVCHGQKLEGTDMGPGIQGPDFRLSWSGRSAAELFDKVKTTMPANDPGSLSPSVTADLVAYILKLNEYPAGAADLPTDTEALGQIRIRHEK